MENMIREFLVNNMKLIHESIKQAAKDSVTVSDNAYGYEVISVVLNTDFEIEVLGLYQKQYTTDVEYVIAEIDCETYFVDYDQITNYLSDIGQIENFNKWLISKGKEELSLNEDEYEATFSEIIWKIEEENDLLEYLCDFDAKIYENFVSDIYDEIDFSFTIDQAIERIFDNLHCETEAS